MTAQRPTKKNVTRRVLPALVLAAIGCGGPPSANYDNVNLVEVGGVVQLDGQPVAGALVEFRDEKTSLSSYGLTNASGVYHLQFDSVVDGTEPGNKVVEISTRRRVLGVNSDDEGGGSEGDEAEEEGEGGGGDREERIPAEYRGKETKLRAKVSKTTTTVDFDLAKDGSTTGPK